MTNHEDVGEFHEKFGLDNTVHNETGPREVPRDLIEMRLNFLLEELRELALACGAGFEVVLHPADRSIENIRIVSRTDEIDHAEAFDALLDLNYVSHGTAHLLGYPWQEGWEAVQAANMAKVRAASAAESKRGSAYDVVKPEGWTAPDQAEILRRHGFDV